MEKPKRARRRKPDIAEADLARHCGFLADEAGGISTRARQACNEAIADRVGARLRMQEFEPILWLFLS